ncbi:MAG TPA: PadR family transcriptional regulator [Chloroflexi bacterium]|jgi:DNA-binding PadR family transcriptional regulator|nr:PadR family transcriptional regulator [Chloroflexota bacterium]
MPIHHAVLALLADGPSYGYELKGRFEESVGPQWGDLNIGHLYQVLDRLERDRLVTKRVVAQTERPDRVVYRLTRAGKTEVERWLETPFVRHAYRDDLFLKLFAASRLGRDTFTTVLDVQRQAYVGELAALRELRERHRDDELVLLLIEAAILHTQADLRVVELAERTAEKLVAGVAVEKAGADSPDTAAEQA